MQLIITLALVHFSSDLERGSEMQLVSYFFEDILLIRFWDNLLELFVI